MTYIPEKLYMTVFERDEYKCVYCGSTETLEIDHVIPVCQGGTNDIENLVTACRHCNRSKSGRTPEEWERSKEPKPVWHFNAKLPLWVEEYVKFAAWKNRKSVTQYILELIERDKEQHNER